MTSHRQAFLAALLAMMATWALLHPRIDLRHDAVLYLGQALARLDPATYAGDLFLSYSGQDRFTVFSLILGRLQPILGIGTAGVLLLLLAQLATFSLLFLLLRPAIGEKWAALGVLLCICAARGYGPQQTFGVAEPFLTARSLAEPLCLAAMLAWQRQRRWVALALLIAASLMHPLIALPFWLGASCALLYGMPKRAWALLLLPLAVVPWLQRFDAEWLAVVDARNAVFLAQMMPGDWCKAVLAALVLEEAARRRPEYAAIWRAVLMAALLGTGAAALLADGMQLVLPTQLQLWRSLWPLQALGLMLMPWLLAQRFQVNPGVWRWSELLAGAAMLTSINASAPSAPWLLLWWLAHRSLGSWPLTALFERLLTGASALLLLLALQGSWQLAGLRGSMLMPFASHQLWMPFLATPLLPGLVGMLFWRWQARRLQCLIASLLLLVAAAIWDQRSSLGRAIDAAQTAPAHPWQATIPAGVGVLWPHQLDAVWTLLRRPVFFDVQQGAAVVLSRPLAMQYAERQRAHSRLYEAELRCQLQHLMLGVSGQPDCETPVAELVGLCQAWPDLRFFVATERWYPAWVSSWRPIQASPHSPTYHLHDCRRIIAATS